MLQKKLMESIYKIKKIILVNEFGINFFLFAVKISKLPCAIPGQIIGIKNKKLI